MAETPTTQEAQEAYDRLTTQAQAGEPLTAVERIQLTAAKAMLGKKS